MPLGGKNVLAWIAALSVRRKTEDQGAVGIKSEVHQLAMGKRAVSLLFSLCYVGRGHSDLLYRFGCQVPVGRIAPLLAGAFIHYQTLPPNGEFVFANTKGNIEGTANIITRGLIPACEDAHVVNGEGERQIHGPAHVASLLCLIMPRGASTERKMAA